MPGKISNKLLIAGSLFILIAGFAIYFIIKDRGHKKEPVTTDNASVEQKDSLVVSEMYSASYDLETPADLENYTAAEAMNASSGKNSSWLNAKTEYSVTIKKKLASIRDFRNIREVVFSFSANSKSPVKNAVVVMSIDDPDGKSVEWIGKTIAFDPGSWPRVEFLFEIKADKLISDGSIKLYVWNKTGEDFFIDDLQFKINGLVSSRSISSVNIPERNIEYDFEVPFEGENSDYYSNQNPHSGKLCYLLNSSSTYSPSVTKKISEVIDSELRLVTMSMWLNQQSDDNEVVLVTTIKDQAGKEYFWQGRSSDKGQFPKGKWVKHRAQFKLPFEKINPDDIISVYAWNKGGKEVFVDDFLVVFGETNVRSGKMPVMDITTVDENGYVFARNKPPYAIKYLQTVTNAHTNADVFEDRILPSEPVCAGTFIPGQGGREQVIRIAESSLFVYDFCGTKNKMNRVAKIDNPVFKNFGPESIIASGNFTGDNSTSLLLADIQKQLIIVGNMEGLNEACSNSGSAGTYKIICQVSKEQFSATIPEKYTHTLTGDFTGDKTADVLFVNPETGGFALLNFKNNAIELIANAVESDALKIAGFRLGGAVNALKMPNGDREIIVMSWSANGKNLSKVLSFNDGNKSFSALPSWTTGMIAAENNLYQGNFSGQGVQVLQLDRSRKFNFTMGGIDQQGLFIDSRLEFSGFTPGYNPKFYEDVKIICGRFMNGNKSGLLVMSANCNDRSFPSNPCKNYETKSAWKPVVQLYYLKD